MLYDTGISLNIEGLFCFLWSKYGGALHSVHVPAKLKMSSEKIVISPELSELVRECSGGENRLCFSSNLQAGVLPCSRAVTLSSNCYTSRR